MKRSRLRRTGKVGRRRSANLRRLLPFLLERAGQRCENPFCRLRRPLDPHHIQKRSQGGRETPENLVMLCRADHLRTDLPCGQFRHLGIEIFTDDFGAWFAIFSEYSDVSAPVPLRPAGIFGEAPWGTKDGGSSSGARPLPMMISNI